MELYDLYIAHRRGEHVPETSSLYNLLIRSQRARLMQEGYGVSGMMRWGVLFVGLGYRSTFC